MSDEWTKIGRGTNSLDSSNKLESNGYVNNKDEGSGGIDGEVDKEFWRMCSTRWIGKQGWRFELYIEYIINIYSIVSIQVENVQYI